jgi:hypothetical protein
MTALPALNYLSNAARTQGEMKTGLDDIVAFLRERLGTGAGWTSVASAATVTLGAQTGRMILLTGTTGISSFGTTNPLDGAVFMLRFAAALTITNGANLITGTGGNINTAAGDTALVVWEGSNVWRIMAYFRAGASGQIIDRAYAEYTTFTGLGTAIPIDDTIPQVGEGTQILSAAITPKNATNRLRIRFRASVSPNLASTWMTAAAFVNGGSNAVAADTVLGTTAGGQITTAIEYEYVPGSTSTQTVTIRVGPSTGSVGVNGNTAAPGRNLGGSQRATLILEEITA